MRIDLLKNLVKNTIKRLESYEESDEVLSPYEIGRLNAYDEILSFIEILEEEALKK